MIRLGSNSRPTHSQLTHPTTFKELKTLGISILQHYVLLHIFSNLFIYSLWFILVLIHLFPLYLVKARLGVKDPKRRCMRKKFHLRCEVFLFISGCLSFNKENRERKVMNQYENKWGEWWWSLSLLTQWHSLHLSSSQIADLRLFILPKCLSLLSLNNKNETNPARYNISYIVGIISIYNSHEHKTTRSFSPAGLPTWRFLECRVVAKGECTQNAMVRAFLIIVWV